MTQETVIAELQRLGMSGYEAKAYIALVAAGAPLNGYEVAKRSGVPRSTVYETLNKLRARGAAYEVHAGDDTVGYLALPPAALLDRLRRDFESSIDVLSAQLPEITAPPEVRLLHGLDSQPGLILRAQDVVAAARRDLFVSGWPAEIESLKPLLKEAERRGVEVSVVTFGHDPDPVGSTTEHRYSAPDVVLENLGCRLLVVAADRSQAVIGGLTERGAWGVFTDDPAVVLVAVEFVRHDIAMHLVVDRLLDSTVFEEFWVNDDAIKRLRDDHGAAAEVLRQTYRPSSQPGRRPTS